MKYTFYPGCAIEASGAPYGKSARAVSDTLGVELIDLDDWNCCGATAYMSVWQDRSLTISSRNLALAEKEGRDVVVICSGCYCVLNKTNHYLAESREMRETVGEALAAVGLEYNGTVKVRHLVDVLANDVGAQALRAAVVNDLSNLKVAAYSGCQLSRPFGGFDDPELPRALDDVVATTGATVVDYPLKARCCAGMLMTTKTEVAETLVGRLLACARDREADCLVTACPLCQVNLECYQDQASAALNRDLHIPVLSFTQLLGAAYGLPAKQLGLDQMVRPVAQLFERRPQAEAVAAV
ncbi:MAG: CoB--CoM heterodisulfide reductase iron-sulfur subunit B family protein [Armatimonadota bacterium]